MRGRWATERFGEFCGTGGSWGASGTPRSGWRPVLPPAVRLFCSDASVALRVDRLQIARMVDLVGCPAPHTRLGFADDVVDLGGRRQAQSPALALGALAESVVTLEDDDAQLFPLVAVAALVSAATLGVRLPASLGGLGALEQSWA